ncbi:beta-ketoacyl synthase N-terminal-like domain-containing protein [Leeuwenhoekiella marinoflava]|uniref:3-oxoacyl-(Acyl-carrier-protein) synthase n=2 Tax=Leeuwenhoekiella marinoflava TaxID=988 RepID=A0A4Q0PRJ3_9FLAO|nr:beta-ketoacyl synthase N-terminal-like domain-containing protein [Leeuwenhoekiella marinoflava]RXG33193.1 3-oxoacyl-(acyl-carrier-protein) synthase [Leeuwenhoekiella marinoflava]SHE42023.1 3-oxoacyl-(acyl-carrier-protein) synthase [Leeuwenhoekiella marinoflava DSM 3653]
MKQPISITGISAISAEESNTSVGSHALCFDDKLEAWVGKLPEKTLAEIEAMRDENRNYQALDASVLYAMYVSRLAVKQSGWDANSDFGINIGSSRGATQLFEKYYDAFLETDKSETLASPTTTLGNISSWVAQDLQNNGPDISHSITCSTALHAVLNGVAWLQSGMCRKFLVGGSEAALTPFTIAQMKAIKTYTRASVDAEFPCLALDLGKTENTMVLGEGAAAVCLEIGKKENALAYINGVGYATEKLKHAVSISAEATCFQKSMKMAIEDAFGETGNDGISAFAEIDKSKGSLLTFAEMTKNVDAIVMHAPGTIAGDQTEYKAIQKIFGLNLPLLTTNKWKIGHTFGASGLLSFEAAVRMLQSGEYEEVPFISQQAQPKKLNTILVNAVGFGGNAVSILITRT